jgi:hypothetical protein
MFWYILLGGSIASALFAFMTGQNPLIWFFTSVPGTPILGLMKPKGKLLSEQTRARREVGNKVGLTTAGLVVGVALVLKLVGVV